MHDPIEEIRNAILAIIAGKGTELDDIHQRILANPRWPNPPIAVERAGTFNLSGEEV